MRFSSKVAVTVVIALAVLSFGPSIPFYRAEPSPEDLRPPTPVSS